MADRLEYLRAIPGLASLSDFELEQLLRICNELAGWFQAPVYLCGSALSKPDPRDYDLRIQLPDADFALRYAGAMKAEAAVARWVEQGLTGAWQRIRWRWSADCTHHTKRTWKLTNLNIDFQVYPMSYCQVSYADAPRLRIDEMPGGKGEPDMMSAQATCSIGGHTIPTEAEVEQELVEAVVQAAMVRKVALTTSSPFGLASVACLRADADIIRTVKKLEAFREEKTKL